MTSPLTPHADEGVVEVDGARLAYRLAGVETALPAVVFENGWSSSFHQWTLLEPLLAPHTRVLFYDRAGIGASIGGRGPDARRMSTDLAGLCASLRLDGPIVVVGQSYGGLVAGLHAAQLPSRVGGIVQLDPTPELDDPFIDAQLKMFRYVGLLSLLLARVRLANPMFASLWEHFPRRQAIALETLSYRSPASLRGALVELRLIPEIRRRIAQHRAERVQPRLVISAGSTHPAKSRLLRRLIDDDKLRATLQRMQALHRDQVAAGSGGIGELAGPHTHGGLVSTPDGAAYSATRIRAFLETVGAPT